VALYARVLQKTCLKTGCSRKRDLPTPISPCFRNDTGTNTNFFAHCNAQRHPKLSLRALVFQFSAPRHRMRFGSIVFPCAFTPLLSTGVLSGVVYSGGFSSRQWERGGSKLKAGTGQNGGWKPRGRGPKFYGKMGDFWPIFRMDGERTREPLGDRPGMRTWGTALVPSVFSLFCYICPKNKCAEFINLASLTVFYMLSLFYRNGIRMWVSIQQRRAGRQFLAMLSRA
jgi:hypothetical protein